MMHVYKSIISTMAKKTWNKTFFSKFNWFNIINIKFSFIFYCFFYHFYYLSNYKIRQRNFVF